MRPFLDMERERVGDKRRERERERAGQCVGRTQLNRVGLFLVLDSDIEIFASVYFWL